MRPVVLSKLFLYSSCYLTNCCRLNVVRSLIASSSSFIPSGSRCRRRLVVAFPSSSFVTTTTTPTTAAVSAAAAIAPLSEFSTPNRYGSRSKELSGCRDGNYLQQKATCTTDTTTRLCSYVTRSGSSSSETTAAANNNNKMDLDTFLMSHRREDDDKKNGGSYKNIFLLDGGTGEELFRSRDVPDDRQIWSATALVNSKYNDALKQVHFSFLNAGSRAVTTNSYGVVPGVGFNDETKRLEYVKLAGVIARQAVNEKLQQQQKDESSADARNLFVFGSLGPLIESYRPDKVLQHEEGVHYYSGMVRALESSVDAYLAETMSSVEESLQAVEAVGTAAAAAGSTADEDDDDHNKKNDKPPLILVSYTLNERGQLRSGEAVCVALPRLLEFANKHNVRVPAILFNCSSPEAINIALRQIRDDKRLSNLLTNSKIRLGCYANRLTPIASDWSLEESDGPQETRNDLSPEQYWEFVKVWVGDLNVSMVGGCCGITPEHIAYLNAKLSE